MIIVQIAGRLGKDPESRFTPSGQKVTNITLATNVRKGGKDETVWWKVIIWGDRFDKMLPYLKKGSAVVVVGEMNKPEIWTDKEGRPQISLEITAEIIRFSPFGNPDSKNEQSGQSANGQANQDTGFGNASPSGYGNSNGNTYGNSQGNSMQGSSMQGASMHNSSGGYSSNQGAMHYPGSDSDDPLPF